MRQVNQGAAKRFRHGAREQSIADDDCAGMCLQAGVEVPLVAEVQVGRGPESKKGLAEMRQRRTYLATRMLAEARGMLRR